MKTIVINLIGSPGTGKSTLASELFSKMKWKGHDVELVSEYAKELIHDAFKDDTREQALAAIRALNMAEIQLARFLYYFCNYNLKEERFVEPKLKLYNLSLGVS